jgi:hypothetical protein
VDGIDEVEVRYDDVVAVVEEVEVIQALTYVNLDGKQKSWNHLKKISICRMKLSITGKIIYLYFIKLMDTIEM